MEGPAITCVLTITGRAGVKSLTPAASDDCLGIGVYGHETLAACSVAIFTTPARSKKENLIPDQKRCYDVERTWPSHPSLWVEGAEAEEGETAIRTPS